MNPSKTAASWSVREYRALTSFSKTNESCSALRVVATDCGSPDCSISRNMAEVRVAKSSTTLNSSSHSSGYASPQPDFKVRRTQANRRSTSSRDENSPPFGNNWSYGSSCRAQKAATSLSRAPSASTTAQASTTEPNPSGGSPGSARAANAPRTSASSFARISETSSLISLIRGTSPYGSKWCRMFAIASRRFAASAFVAEPRSCATPVVSMFTRFSAVIDATRFFFAQSSSLMSRQISRTIASDSVAFALISPIFPCSADIASRAS
mmetsp:Transcript_16536/g.51753  ORF Transcript_16536/g.51753 Transcript_16536/m.51753 type:complete len:267 (+) Transcript_16536:1332-2132(+)